MSHFASYECKANRLEFIKSALKEMGYGFLENVKIKDYYGQERTAALAVSKDGLTLPVGWIRNDKGELDLQADWYNIGMSQRDFINTLGQLHSKSQVIESCDLNGWNIDTESITTNEKGEVELIATQYN